MRRILDELSEIGVAVAILVAGNLHEQFAAAERILDGTPAA
jgi:hypothetical protein